MSIIRLPGMLRALTGGIDEIAVDADTVPDALEELVHRHPRLRRHLFDETGQLRGYVNVYLNDEDVRFAGGTAPRLGSEDVITIVPSVAGGSGGSPILARAGTFGYTVCRSGVLGW